MKRLCMTTVLALAAFAAEAADPCDGKVAAGIVAHDRAARLGAGFLLNRCGQPVRAELMVLALNRYGFPVSRGVAVVRSTGAEPLSLIVVELPFVQSVVELSGYSAVVEHTAVLETPDDGPNRTAGERLSAAAPPR